MWVGVDDTDGPSGGCTTWVLSELLALAREFRLAPIGPPRLVRLNPNVPWKTRGNAALSVRLGRGLGPKRRVGAIGRRPLFEYERGGTLEDGERRAFLDAAWRRVLAASPEEPGTDPALVIAPRRPSPDLYWKAVRDVVEVEEAKAALRTVGASWRTRGEERGLIGATASIAWPARRATWELIAYRSPERVGTHRSIDPESVRDAQRRDPRLFLCHDPRTRRLLVAPHTACPILYGLRATDRTAPVRASRTIRSEPVDRWVVFRTNQGSGDHLLARHAEELGPYRSAIVTGVVAGLPRALRGGHVAFTLRDGAGSALACIAFEPTKTLPRAAQQLHVGDRIEVWGGRSESPELRLEGLRIVRLARAVVRSPPRCPDCRRATGSLGRGRGFRCPACRRTFPPEAAVERAASRELRVGVIHPTPSARRHLAPRALER